MPVSTDKEQVAREMGISAEAIHDYRYNYILNLTKRGLRTDLDIGRWRAYCKLVEEEVGLVLSAAERRSISLGHQKLLPSELVRRSENAESRGRANLEKHTIQLVIGRFLPVTAAESFKLKNDECKAELFAVRDEIIQNYETIVGQMKLEFGERAEATWSRLENKPKESFHMWQSRYVSSLLERIPTKDKIRDSYYWTTRYDFIPLPSSIQEETLRQEKLRQEQDLLAFETEDRRNQIKAMNEIALSQMREQQAEAAKQMGSFLDDTLFTLRNTILETVQKAARTISRNDGKLLGSTVKSLQNLVEQSRMLNFYNDQEVAQLVDKLDAQISKEPDKRSVPDVKKIMREMEQTMSRSVRAVERQQTKDDEIARIIGIDVIKTARRVE